MDIELRYGPKSANGKRPIAWTKTQLRFIQREYTAGASLMSIAEYFELPSHSAITLVCDKYGWTRRKADSKSSQFKDYIAANHRKYLKLYRKPGWSAAMVAEQAARDAGIEWITELGFLYQRIVKLSGAQKSLSEVTRSLAGKAANLRATSRRIRHYLNYEAEDYDDYLWTARRLAYITVPVWSSPFGWKYRCYGFVIDHMLSIHSGYHGLLPLRIVGHPCNLQQVTGRYNAKKGNRNDLTTTELKRKIQQYDRVYGDPFDLEHWNGKEI